MKKLIYLFLTVLIVACSSDDGNSNNSIVGNWKISDCPGLISNEDDLDEDFI